MSEIIDNTDLVSYWFVGSMWDDNDETGRFLDNGIWENGYDDKFIDLVKSVKVGDKIAIKSSFKQKNNLPFNSNGFYVSCMYIKAIGTVTKNYDNGTKLDVSWDKDFKQKTWYFTAYRSTIVKVDPDNGDWCKALIDLSFNNKDQNINDFINSPSLRERFGDSYQWTKFYEEVADKLLLYKNKRTELLEGIRSIGSRVDVASAFQDELSDKSNTPLKDICPFTVMGIFNRGITDKVRVIIATELAKFLDVKEAVPNNFDGVTRLDKNKSFLFSLLKGRKSEDIDDLWDVFEKAIAFADSKDENGTEGSEFSDAYDKAIKQYKVGWNLSIGLYWVRPWQFVTLTILSRNYIVTKLGIESSLKDSNKKYFNSGEYISLIDEFNMKFKTELFLVHSFPALSHRAYLSKNDLQDESVIINADIMTDSFEPYSIDNIISDGCFMDISKLENIINRLRDKKNIILQGPPGTGKTWLARKLAYALIGEENSRNVRVVQFHPNLSYEDFILGFRPIKGGTLDLVYGPFIEMINLAKANQDDKYVIVIEEINRGNPAQIFGEMLTLLEASKRNESEALELSYSTKDNEPVYIPENLYVIGTMNLADRSLALVDFAFRRRFAFIDLEPLLGDKWKERVHKENKIDVSTLTKISDNINELNKTIIEDISLGKQSCIGHSYVTPSNDTDVVDAKKWFCDIVETEIVPLLNEYWFDDPKKTEDAKKKLLAGFEV